MIKFLVMAIMFIGEYSLANLFSRKIKGEEHRSQLQPVVFSDDNQSIAALKKSQLDSYDEIASYKRLRKKRTKIACIRMLVWLAVILLVPIFVFFSIVIINPKAGHNFFGYTVYIVTSNSMEPEINVGDCIVVKGVSSKEDITVGTDIAFVRSLDGQTVTHRVIDIMETPDGDIKYITKGINVPTADSGAVAFENILGVRIKTIGWLGQMVSFFRTPYGIVVFLIIMVLIIVGFRISFVMSNDIRAVGNK